MFIVATATFRILYTLIVLDHDRRKIIHFGVAENPTQVWLSHQITEAFPWDTAPRYLLRARDASYGPAFRARVKGMGVEEVVIAPRAPWQNPYRNPRGIHPPLAGKIVAFPEFGGLHHRYERRPA